MIFRAHYLACLSHASYLVGDDESKVAVVVDPSQYEVMKTNFAITKMMSDQELQAIEAYMYSNLK